MDPSCLEFALTDSEAATFERDGFLVVEEALSDAKVAELSELMDRLVASGGYTHTPHGARAGRVNAIDVAGLDPALIELVDHPRTLPKVWGILGWNIHLYHSHYITAEQIDRPSNGGAEATLGWHQDSGQINQDLETNPRPRLSLKVAYFLSDASEPDRGNFWVLPGSHLRNEIEVPASGRGQPDGAMPVCVTPGTAVLFDRRLWHAGSPNYAPIVRKALFYGYSHRWVHARDEVTVPPDLWEAADPIRRQLLGYSTSQHGRTSPTDEDVPLRGWLEQHQPAMAAL